MEASAPPQLAGFPCLRLHHAGRNTWMWFGKRSFTPAGRRLQRLLPLHGGEGKDSV